MKKYIDELAVNFPEHSKLISYVGSDDLFLKGWGSSVDSPHHHAYEGGLADHTLEVMDIASMMALRVMRVNDLEYANLMVAATWHDYMKIRTYDKEGKKTLYYKKFGHVVPSADMFRRISDYNTDPEILKWEDKDEIVHAILAHHGKHEWRSPVEPQTRIARILHAADYASAFAKLK